MGNGFEGRAHPGARVIIAMTDVWVYVALMAVIVAWTLGLWRFFLASELERLAARGEKRRPCVQSNSPRFGAGKDKSQPLRATPSGARRLRSFRQRCREAWGLRHYLAFFAIAGRLSQ